MSYINFINSILDLQTKALQEAQTMETTSHRIWDSPKVPDERVQN
jgi:hypothetical protein